MRKILTNELVYLGLSILQLNKTVIYEFWYAYIKPKYYGKTKLFYMDTKLCYICIKTDDIYKNIAEVVETGFNTSCYKLDRPLPKGTNKKATGLMKDELGETIMIEFVTLREKTFSYFRDYYSEDKKAKDTKKCVIKRKLKFENYKNCLEATQLENKINHLQRNEIDQDSHKKDHK